MTAAEELEIMSWGQYEGHMRKREDGGTSNSVSRHPEAEEDRC